MQTVFDVMSSQHSDDCEIIIQLHDVSHSLLMKKKSGN